MTKKRKVASVFGTGAMALALLGAFSVQTLRQEPVIQTLDTPSAYSLNCENTISPYTRQKPTPEPHVRPMLADTRKDRVTAPPESNPALVGEKTAKAQLISTFLAEIDFEPQKPSDRPAILTSKEPSRDNPTPKPLLAPTPSQQAPVEPKMGDTRIIDGQKQVYFLGFGWIEDDNTPNECEYVEDMYENGNKVGSMVSGTYVDGDGDINKMVGTMGGGETGRSCGDINKQVGAMD